ncbi:MAG: DUF465 domain-containing protein [Acidobacteria bacterium]|nr:DUF465 domain-containing protein [Acidobacteriota bacterium]
MGSVISEAELREQLMLSNEQFRRLATEHHAHAERLEKLNARHFLSEEEKLEEITLKKKKLLLKDQMYAILQKYRRELEGKQPDCLVP